MLKVAPLVRERSRPLKLTLRNWRPNGHDLIIHPMSIAQMRRQIKAKVDALPAGRLRVAADFLSCLQERGESDATLKLLAIPGFAEELQQPLKQIRSGSVTSVDKLRRKPRTGHCPLRAKDERCQQPYGTSSVPHVERAMPFR